MESFIPPDYSQQIKRLVANDQLVQCCSLLENTFLEKEAIALKGRLKNLEDRNQRGLLEAREYEVSKNKIRENILELSERLEEKKTNPNGKNLYLFYLIIGGIFLLIPLYILSFSRIYEEKNFSIFTVDSAYHILLLPFGPDGNCKEESNQYHWHVQKRLEQLNKSENLSIEVQRQDTIMCDLFNNNSVRSYGEKMGADLVIFGNYQERCEWDTTLLNIRYVSVDIAKDTTAIGVNKKPKSKEDESKEDESKEGFLDTKSYLSMNSGSKSIFTEGDTSYLVHENKSLNVLSKGDITGTVEDVIYWSLGLREFDRRAFQISIYYWNKISISSPKKEYSIIFRNKGMAYHMLEQYQEAIQDFNRAIELNPDDAYSYVQRGVTRYFLNQNQEAIMDFDKAINLSLENAYLYSHRGLANYYLGKNIEAKKDFDKAIILDPHYPFSYQYRATVDRALYYQKMNWKNSFSSDTLLPK